jgi:small subunit ribosomal protein S24e
MMDLQIVEEKNNPLLKRREIVFRLKHDAETPSRKSVVERIAATMNSKPGLVVVDHMNTEFGKRETLGYAKIYESEERVNQVENPHLVARNTFTEAKEAKSPEAS